MNIRVGDKFPAFSGESQHGETIDLADFQGKQKVVIYFYPKDRTPGCTREAIDFDRKYDEFQEAGAALIGVSVDPLDSHKEFSMQCGLRFPLLSDDGRKLGEQLGILNEKGMTKRTTFVLAKDGTVEKIYEVNQVDGHADEVLDFVRGMA